MFNVVFTIYQTGQTCQTSQIPETYPLTPETYLTLVRYMVTKPLSLGVL